ncbi:S-layer family protein, partial [Nostoc cf. edaphicum LEGE 07299]
GGGLQVQQGKTLALIGGDLTLEGGNLTASGGRIELGSIAGPGVIGLNVDSNNLRLSFPNNVLLANILLTNGARLDLSSNDVQLLARRIVLFDGSAIVADTLDIKPGGTLTLNASDSVQLIGSGSSPTRLLTATTNSQNAGNLIINTGKLIVQDGARISTGVYGAGQGGNLIVNASESVELTGTYINNLFASGLFSNSLGIGDAGDLSIQTGKLIVRDGAQISTGVNSAGRGGNLIVNASESVELTGRNANNLFASGLFSNSLGNGNAGDLRINTGKLIVRDGARISTGVNGAGKGGNLIVNASESVELTGRNANNLFASGLFSNSLGIGDAGNLSIQTGKLSVRNGAEINVSSGRTGNAGNLQVATRYIKLDNQGKLLANSVVGRGGNITLSVRDLLLLQRNSEISTVSGTEQAGGDSGNFTLNMPDGFIVATPNENSDIITNAFTGTGGKITIRAFGVFGMVVRDREELVRLLETNDPSRLDPRRLPTNDITSFSQTGSSLEGTTELQFTRVELPTNLVDASQLFDTICSPRSKQQANSFIITGRGGLPPNPKDILSPDAVQVDWVTLNPSTREGKSPPVTIKPTTATPKPIVEATGWVRNAKGELELTANALTKPHGLWQNPVSCRAASYRSFITLRKQ